MHRLLAHSLRLLCLSAALLPATAGAYAVYDGFDGYPIDEDIWGRSGGTGWNGGWSNIGTGRQVIARSDSLPGGDLLTSPGHGAATAPEPDGSYWQVAVYQRQLAEPLGIDGSTVWLSFLLRPQDPMGDYGGFNLNGLFIGKSGTSDYYSLEYSTVEPSTRLATPGETVLLVVRAAFESGNDLFELFIDPLLGAAAPTLPDATYDSADLGTFEYVWINNAGGFDIDELRIGDSFGAVTPTGAAPVPGVALLIAGGLAGLAASRRGRRRR